MSNLTYILSQPRSGSTVLTAILDKRKGVVCMPEASFPQVLGHITRKERADKRWLAALYLGSTFPPTPLTIDDAESCMSGSDDEILFSLGRALAGKLGRNPSDVTHVVWKTTRTIGMNEGPLATQGKFVVLRRHPHNVFESQFRFDHGIRNRKPLRYAIFAQSYENAHMDCPADRTFELDYDEIPSALPSLFDFIGFPDHGEWQEGTSSMEIVAASCSWLTQITEEFVNTDVEKRSRLDPAVVRSVDRALALTRHFIPYMGPLRRHFDNRSLGHIRQFAREAMTTTNSPESDQIQPREKPLEIHR